MKFRLNIADDIEFPVTIKVRNGGSVEDHKFHLTAARIDSDAAADLFSNDTEAGAQPLRDFLASKVKGWRGQKLVIGEDDKPAAFDAEAFGALLTIPGAAVVIYTDYLREIAASSGAEGRRKN